MKAGGAPDSGRSSVRQGGFLRESAHSRRKAALRRRSDGFQTDSGPPGRSPHTHKKVLYLPQHLTLRPQQILAERRYQKQQQRQSDNHLQLNIDGKDVDLRDYLHEDAHTHLAQQFCSQIRKSK